MIYILNMRSILILSIYMLSVCGSATLADIAMQQPGIDESNYNFDNHSYMVAMQPSTTATSEDLDNAAIAVIMEFATFSNEYSYEGKLILGITDRPGRVIKSIEVGSMDAIKHSDNTSWQRDVLDNAATWEDDTRNYDPYGNRYTSFPDGKGVIGSMVMKWLGFVKIGNLLYRM